jgi:hypothetical protein
MLRDDAIREGKIEPTEQDIERMKLSKGDLAEIGKNKAALQGVKVSTETDPAAGTGADQAKGSQAAPAGTQAGAKTAKTDK